MSEGIVELEGETKEDEEVGEEVEADKEGVKSKKPKTRWDLQSVLLCV